MYFLFIYCFILDFVHCVDHCVEKEISTDIKLSQSQLPKIIQLGGCISKMLGNLGNKKALLDLAVPLVKDVLPALATKATSSALDKFERKINGKSVVKAGKEFALFVSNGDINDIIRIVKSLKKKEVDFFGL